MNILARVYPTRLAESLGTSSLKNELSSIFREVSPPKKLEFSMNEDVLYVFCSRLDNKTLQAMSRTPLWNDIKLFINKQSFWYLRTQYLLGAALKERYNVDWRSAYQALISTEPPEYSWQVLTNPLALEVLLESGKNPTGALTTAARNGYFEAAKILLSHPQVDPTENNNEPLLLATGKMNVLELLVSDPRVDASIWDNAAIKNASRHGGTEVVRLLLANPKVDPTAEDNAAIRLASQYGHPEVVKLLLADNRVDPTAQDNYAIKLASQYGYPEVVKLLLADPRVDPTAQDNYAIKLASQYGYSEVVRLLLADPRVDPSADENYAIRYASQLGYPEVVKLLLADPRVDPTVQDNYAIKSSSRFGQAEVVELLLADPRVDPTAEDNYAVRYASRLASDKTVILLLSDPRIDQTADNNYAIRINSQSGHVDAVKLLLANPEVDPTADDNYAIRYATTLGHTEVLKLLLNDYRVDLQDVGPRKMTAVTQQLLPNFNLTNYDFENNHYDFLLRELLLKRRDVKYFFKWLLEQCKRHPDALEYRQLIAEAAKSYRGTEPVIHTSPLFTAYSGFLLLAKTSDKKSILDLLKSEGATQGGLQLAEVLLAAYLRPSY